MLVCAPYAVSVPLAFALADRLDPANAAGLVALALAPGAFLAPSVMSAAGGRRSDMAGALVLGTVILSFVLVATRPGTSTLAVTGLQAFTIASLVGGAMPTLRDRFLAPLRWAGRLAAVVVIILAAASGAVVEAGTVIAAVAALAVTLGVSGAVALALGRDVFSALAAAGTRDPIVAIALAWSTGGPSATAVPLVNAVILGTIAAALVIRAH